MGKRETIQTKIISEEEVIFYGDCDAVVVPTKQGRTAILPYHTPMIIMLAGGVIELKIEKENRRIAEVKKGLAYVANNEVSILVNV